MFELHGSLYNNKELKNGFESDFKAKWWSSGQCKN